MQASHAWQMSPGTVCFTSIGIPIMKIRLPYGGLYQSGTKQKLVAKILATNFGK